MYMTNYLRFCCFEIVTVNVKARIISVKGTRGTVTKNFSHLPCEIQKLVQKEKKRQGNFIRIRMWFGGYRQACSVNTLKKLINNMITGVTEVSTSLIKHSNSTSSSRMGSIFTIIQGCTSLFCQ